MRATIRHGCRRTGWLACLTVAGCVGLHGRPPHLHDPPWLSPQNQPLHQPVIPGGTQVAPPRTLPPTSAPDSMDQPQPLESDDEEGPVIVPPSADAPRIDLTVAAPQQLQLGSAAKFELTVRNAGNRPVEDVEVVATFDDGFVFPGTTEREARRPLGRLGPGEERSFTLMLVGEETGRLCSQFSVRAGGREALWKSVCVEFVPRSVQLELIGPPHRTVGGRAEFTIKVANVSSRPLERVDVTVTADRVLQPLDGTRGAVRRDDVVSWDVGRLDPGAGAQLQIEFVCRGASVQACVAAEVTAAGRPAVAVEKCLTITSPSGPVEMQIEDLQDPVAAGSNVVYRVVVHNRAASAAAGAEVLLKFPAGLWPTAAEVRRGDQTLPAKGAREEQAVRFPPVDLPPSSRTEFYVRVHAERSGDHPVQALLTHRSLPAPLETVEPTTVNP